MICPHICLSISQIKNGAFYGYGYYRTLIGNPIVSLLLLCINSDIICPGDHVSIVLYYDTACICSTWRVWGWVYAWVCMNDVLRIWEACDVFYLRNAGYASVMFAISWCPSLCITSRIVSKWLDGSCCFWHLRPILHSVISKIPVSPKQLKQGFCFLEPCRKVKMSPAHVGYHCVVNLVWQSWSSMW